MSSLSATASKLRNIIQSIKDETIEMKAKERLEALDDDAFIDSEVRDVLENYFESSYLCKKTWFKRRFGLTF